MRRLASLILLCVILGGALLARDWWANRLVDLSSLSEKQWRDDLDFLARHLARKHKDAFHRINQNQYANIVAEIGAELPDLHYDQIPVAMLKLTAAVGDAHTYVQLPSPERIYPVQLYWFGEDLRIVRASRAFGRTIGARILKIDGIRIEEIAARLRKIFSQGENRWSFLRSSPYLARRPEILHYLGVSRSIDRATFTLEDDSGATYSEEIAAVDAKKVDWVDPYPKPPLHIEHANDDFWFTNASPETVYVIFNSYDSLRSNARALFDYIDHHATSRLILDMRGNVGGDFKEGLKYLIEPIKKRPAVNRRGHLFVITGRATFSAAMNNACQFHTQTNAILVGEPPGEVPNGFQEVKQFTLPNSHIKIRYSSEYYRFLDQDVPALIPDTPIEPDWGSYREGRDPALEWILAQPFES